MLTRLLFLAAGWLVVSAVAMLLWGARLKRRSALLSLIWLVAVLVAGNVWALLTFGVLREVEVLTAIALVAGVFWIVREPNWNSFGHVAWVTTVLTTLLYLAYTFDITAFTALHAVAFAAAIFFFFLEFAALVLGLSFAFEAIDVLCRVRWKRRFAPFAARPEYTPKVSLHVPAYNEPVEVVEGTLKSLAQLNYPYYEVLVVDNNTPDEENWRSLESLAHSLGPQFHFLHLEKWPGYKSGALNFALTQTAPDTEIIGVVDADYRVDPDWLQETIPAFADPQVAFVQSPQDYREVKKTAFAISLYYGYKYFFEVSMPSRNERNAIIFAGTMGLIRKPVLQEIGGWDEWCITEDAEASLRILKRGYQSIYIKKAYGRGIMPLDFDGLKRQRFRWCFGGIQILRRHWESLMPWARWIYPNNRLTGAQRYHYLFGGLQWYNDLLNLLFAIFLILGAVMNLNPRTRGFLPLTGPLLIMPALFLALGLWRFMWALRHALHLRWRTALRTMANFFSLGWAVTLGSVQGLIQPKGVFLRTPKQEGESSFAHAVRVTQWETSLGLLCVVVGVGIMILHPHLVSFFLGFMLLWQGSYFLAALVYSIQSARTAAPQPRRVSIRPDRPGLQVRESLAARVVVVLIAIVVLVAAVVAILPSPGGAPPYIRLSPPHFSPGQLIGLPTSPATATGAPGTTPGPTATGAPGGTPGPTATGGATPAATAVPSATPGGTSPTPTP